MAEEVKPTYNKDLEKDKETFRIEQKIYYESELAKKDLALNQLRADLQNELLKKDLLLGSQDREFIKKEAANNLKMIEEHLKELNNAHSRLAEVLSKTVNPSEFAALKEKITTGKETETERIIQLEKNLIKNFETQIQNVQNDVAKINDILTAKRAVSDQEDEKKKSNLSLRNTIIASIIVFGLIALVTFAFSVYNFMKLAGK